MKSIIGTLICLGLLWGRCVSGEAGESPGNEENRAGSPTAEGATIILDDFATCLPRSAIATESVKGKWWLREYHTASGQTGTMLCVEERDMDNPETCLVPEVKYPVKLEGMYDIWVGTYRPAFGGGVDIKLSRDKVYGTLDPWQTGLNQWPPPDEQTGRIVECFWKTADLTDQDIYLRQPHGTYGSFWWGWCQTHVAYIKLIPRDPQEVARYAAERLKVREKGAIINRDGFSWIWSWGTDNLDCILQQVENLQYDNVDAVDFCIGGLASANFNHPMTSGRVGIPGGRRLGDKRARRVFQKFYQEDTDILKILTQRCHELRIKIYASHRFNARYQVSDVWRQHPEWRLESGRAWDLSKPGPREYCRDFLLYVAENYDIDGITLDFSRGARRHVNPDEPNKLEPMNRFMRDFRAGLNKIAEAKGKALALNATFVCHTRYESATPADQGLDIKTWVDEGLVDLIMPHGRDAMDYVKMCKGEKAKCYVRTSRGLDFAGQALGAHHHDPRPEEDKKDRPVIQRWFPLDYIEELLRWYDAGADGVFLFNLSDGWVTYRNLGYPKLLREEVASGQPLGMRERPPVEWME